MTSRSITVALLLMLPLVAAAEDHPKTVGARVFEDGYDRGYEWQAASRVLDASGTMKAGRQPAFLRRMLEWQIREGPASLENHGLEDGEIPPADLCREVLVFSEPLTSAESEGEFAPALLLAEVAVLATLGEGVPGFDVEGSPTMLFALTDVERLHGRSFVPDYLLAPLEGLVIRGRLFCGHWLRPWENAPHPTSGDRLVLIGRWHRDGVLRAIPHDPDAVGLAQVVDDDRLKWNTNFGIKSGGPSTLSELEERVAEAVLGGLFDVTAPLMAYEYNAPERRKWAREWVKLHQDGCRVAEVARGEDDVLVPVRRICQRRVPR